MKRKWILACMMLGSACATKANGNKFESRTNGNKTTTSLANARASILSEEMIKGLQLNNYQSQKVREINLKVAEQITALEELHAGDQAKIEALSQNILAERDRYLESVLSTVQYNEYFNSRPAYNKLDEAFISKSGETSEPAKAVASTETNSK